MTLRSDVPASPPLTPELAMMPVSAANVSIDCPAAVNAGAPFWTASKSCSILVLAVVVVFANTSLTRARFSVSFAVLVVMRPKAPNESDAMSVARARSTFEAVAKSTTPGSAAIDCSASKPAIAKNSRPPAACVAENSVVAPTSRAVFFSWLNVSIPSWVLRFRPLNLADADTIAAS